MAATSGGTGADLTPGEAGSLAARLFAEPYRFDFFQAVRVLEHLARQGTATHAPVGGVGPPAAEPVRFRVPATLNFPPSPLVAITAPTANRMPELTVAFFGLVGPSGIMPRHYTERVARLVSETKEAERFALRDWLDLFHHRLLSHFYRSWAKYRLWVAREREPGPGPDPFTTALQAFVGLATPGLTGRGTVTAPDTGPKPGPPRTLAALSDDITQLFAGHFARRPRTAAGLKAVVSEYLGLPVRVDPFRGQWLSVDAGDRAQATVLGGAALGTGPILGERVWDVQSKFRVRVGPVSRKEFDELLPDPSPTPVGKKFYLLMHLIRLYAGPEFDVEVQFVVRATEVPKAVLPTAAGRGPRLGRNAWLVSMTPDRDAGHAAFTVADRPARRETL